MVQFLSPSEYTYGNSEFYECLFYYVAKHNNGTLLHFFFDLARIFQFLEFDLDSSFEFSF